jgi:hypothetical protein
MDMLTTFYLLLAPLFLGVIALAIYVFSGVKRETMIWTMATIGLVILLLLGSNLLFSANLHYAQRVTADEFEAQYNLTTKGGNAMDRCVRAGLVAEAHLQAQNFREYENWKDQERRDCRRAGLGGLY